MPLTRELVRRRFASASISREAVEFGRVMVDDSVETDPSRPVQASSTVSVDGVEVRSDDRILVLMNKPRSYACSEEPYIPHMFELIPPGRGWSFPCGAMPRSMGGIVLLSTDAQFGHDADGPLAVLTSDYSIKVPGIIEPDKLINLRLDRCVVGRYTARATWLSINKTRMSHTSIGKELKGAGMEILSWERRRLGPFRVSDLPTGAWRRVRDDEQQALISIITMGLDDATPIDQVWTALIRKSGR